MVVLADAAGALGISPKVATVTVEDATPTTLTATLTGSTGVISWSLSGPGNLSTTTGPTTEYTPPVSGGSGAAIVTASAGGFSSSAVIALNASPPPLNSESLGDDGSDGLYAQGAGTVFVIAGTIGKSLSACSHLDLEFAYFATHHCSEESSTTVGYLLIDASDTELSVQFVPTVGSYTDGFAIR
jgi:hypothetical protein